MTDCVIFDLDGTLIDSAGICAAIINEMHAERGSGQSVSYEEVRVWSSIGGEKMIAALLGDHCGDPAIEIADFRKRYATRPTPVDSLFAGVGVGLRQLRARQLRLAICSNKPQGLCEKVLADCGLAELFDVVVGGAPDRKAKPHPDLLDRTLDALDLDAHQCIYVGDSEVDHEVAATRAMRFLFVNYGYAADGWDAPGVERHDQFGQVVNAVINPRKLRKAMQAAAKAA